MIKNIFINKFKYFYCAAFHFVEKINKYMWTKSINKNVFNTIDVRPTCMKNEYRKDVTIVLPDFFTKLEI